MSLPLKVYAAAEPGEGMLYSSLGRSIACTEAIAVATFTNYRSRACSLFSSSLFLACSLSTRVPDVLSVLATLLAIPSTPTPTPNLVLSSEVDIVPRVLTFCCED